MLNHQYTYIYIYIYIHTCFIIHPHSNSRPCRIPFVANHEQDIFCCNTDASTHITEYLCASSTSPYIQIGMENASLSFFLILSLPFCLSSSPSFPSLYVYICTYIHICRHYVYIYVRIYIYVYTYICIHICVLYTNRRAACESFLFPRSLPHSLPLNILFLPVTVRIYIYICIHISIHMCVQHTYRNGSCESFFLSRSLSPSLPLNICFLPVTICIYTYTYIQLYMCVCVDTNRHRPCTLFFSKEDLHGPCLFV